LIDLCFFLSFNWLIIKVVLLKCIFKYLSIFLIFRYIFPFFKCYSFKSFLRSFYWNTYFSRLQNQSHRTNLLLISIFGPILWYLGTPIIRSSKEREAWLPSELQFPGSWWHGRHPSHLQFYTEGNTIIQCAGYWSCIVLISSYFGRYSSRLKTTRSWNPWSCLALSLEDLRSRFPVGPHTLKLKVGLQVITW
jgi:hypothetical protein